MRSSLNSISSEKPFYADLQILLSVLLLAATLYISGFEALVVPYFIFYLLALIQILLLFSGYMYERREFKTNLSEILLVLDKWFFILVFSSLVYIISQAMLIKISKNFNGYYTYLIPFIFSIITAILLVLVLNEVNKSEQFKVKIIPQKIQIFCLDDESDIDNDEPSFYIVINNNSKREAEIEITLNYDHTSLRVDGGSIFKDDTASFKLTNKNGGVENIGINVSCSKDTTDIYSLISKVVFNNKIKFERSTIIETIKIGKSEVRRVS